LLNQLDGSRLLILTGERRAESTSRAHQAAWSVRSAAPTLPRLVLWHRLILDWPHQKVFSYLAQEQVPLPYPYLLGWSRHSCVLCIHKTMPEMVLSYIHAWRRAAERVALEEELQNQFWRYEYGSYRGWRAIWELTYGTWQGIPAKQPPIRAEALAIVDALRQRAVPA